MCVFIRWLKDWIKGNNGWISLRLSFDLVADAIKGCRTVVLLFNNCEKRSQGGFFKNEPYYVFDSLNNLSGLCHDN